MRICRSQHGFPSSESEVNRAQRLTKLDKQMEHLMMEIKKVNKQVPSLSSLKSRARPTSPNQRFRVRFPSQSRGGNYYH